MKKTVCSLTLLALASPTALAQMRPFVYHEGNLVWERNRWLEDNADTVHVLAQDLVALDPLHDQDSALGYPEMLVFNQAQFTPAEGEPAGPGERRLNEESIDRKGLQLYVNYGDALVATSGTSPERYDQGLFFISLSEGGFPINAQPEIPVPVVPFSGVTMSASRGTFGNLTLPGVGTYAALYVTGSVGYDPTALANPSYAVNAALDRLYLDFPGLGWIDISWSVPIGVRASNNSGVAIADFDGDGVEEIYVGRQGNDYGGMQDALLRLNPLTGYFFEDTTMIPSPYPGATTEVSAADLDLDGDLDIVVANRSPRSSSQPAQETNFVLLNDGVSQFARVDLLPAAGASSDSRSVAVADIAGDGRLEVVFGNAGSNGFIVGGELPVADDDPMQVWSNHAGSGTTTFVDVTFPQGGVPPEFQGGALPGPVDERKWTSGLTFQVLLQDVVTPSGGSFLIEPDGLPDLVIVNHRYALRQSGSANLGSTNNVQILVNRSVTQPTQSIFDKVKTLNLDWAKTVCFADYVKYEKVLPPPAVLDERVEPFVGTGNRFAGSLNRVFWSPGAKNWSESGDGADHFDSSYDTIPGNERGYGFDFATSGVFGEGLDAIQTSRGYQFLTIDMLDPNDSPFASWKRHWDLTEPSPHTELGVPGPHAVNGSLHHRRGWSEPKGGEDGCFANLDDDPELELLFVGQRSTSRSHPDPSAGTAIVSVLNSTNQNSYNDHARTSEPYFDLTTGGVVESYFTDDKIDRGARDAYPTAQNSDRVQAADLDNDGDIDAIATLFPVQDHSGASSPAYVHDMTFFHPNTDRFNFGFMYLENVWTSGTTGAWFNDVATTKMTDDVVNPPVFRSDYNRGRGDIGLADLDNNGAIDLFAVQTPEKDLSNADTITQLRELIFLNGIKGDAVGTLREMSATIFPPGPPGSFEFGPAPNIAARTLTEALTGTPDMASGGSSVDWGDVDNDGDVDLLVARGVSNYPGLLINNGLPGDQLSFADDFAQRVPVAALDPIIESITAFEFGTGNPLPGIDGSGQARFIDFDGDGDLDMVLTVPGQVLRMLRNTGTDSNGDGLIDAADTPAPGYFEDVSSIMQSEHRVIIDSSDTQVIDVDQDGDYDLAVDGWWDEACFWRNERPLDLIPRVSEIWPRIGATRGSTITLKGANLDLVNVVALSYKNSVELIYLAAPSGDPNELTVTLPANLPVGFARVHVAVLLPPLLVPSKQYAGYCILGN